jgi:hypothetical protein
VLTLTHRYLLRIFIMAPLLLPLEDFKPRHKESPQDQAERYFQKLKEATKENTQDVAILYAANDSQAVTFHEANKKQAPLPIVKGSGQAELFAKLCKLINAEPGCRIRVLPIATSVYGGENSGDNIVSMDSIRRDLGMIKSFSNAGIVYGIPRSKDNTGTQYAIGGGVSKHWLTQRYAKVVVAGEEKTTSQGDFVQRVLTDIQQGKSTDYLDRVVSISVNSLHYVGAIKERKHSITVETQIEGLSKLTGDALKTEILFKFKSIISELTSEDLIQRAYNDFLKSAEYKILATPGWLYPNVPLADLFIKSIRKN